ncbi:MAG: glutamate-5-semialdehyde dehydrogenase [Candidatus Goldiibacteriota bacterium HGW-Goldbacteria-1]|nr:MAG: glutamate-5-semialdehyde dehydrogenase [Candidatus Goldiibacteriota bacterium HGW-Goldbacteria-1]
MDEKEAVLLKCKSVKKASRELVKFSTADKNRALSLIAEGLDKNRAAIKEQNNIDLANGKTKGLSEAFLDRLALNDKRIDEMIKALKDVIQLPDPVGEITHTEIRPNGLKIQKIRMPLGVIGIIFESRPNVCVEAASLTLKSGNAVILKGGSDAINSNICLTGIIKEGIKNAGLPEGAVEVIESTSREAAAHLVKMKEYVDVIIPRGGYGLIKFIEENSLIPVIRHDAGICHTYVDSSTDMDMAVKVCFNAKVQRPSTCNAMETLLVNSKIADKFLPVMAAEYAKVKVELRGDDRTRTILKNIKEATEQDWITEYNDLILSIKIVDNLDEAIEHINTYSSHHSDAIITQDKTASSRFLNEVDSAAVYVNASTRFTDGNEFGLGAEMGISNQKLHVRGPLALLGLTSEKYIITGSGQIRG